MTDISFNDPLADELREEEPSPTLSFDPKIGARVRPPGDEIVFNDPFADQLGVSSSQLAEGRLGGGGSVFSDIVGGTLSGLRQDPLIGRNIVRGLQGLGVLDEEQVQELIARSTGGVVSDTFELAAEFAPSLVVGGGLFSAGRALATRGLSAAAKRAVARGSTNRQLGQVAARATQQEATGLGANIPAPFLERATQIAGGSAALAPLGGAEVAARGGDPIQGTAFTFAAAVAGEGALIGLARVLGSRRPINVQEVLAGPQMREVDEFGKQAVAGLTVQVNTAQKNLTKLEAELQFGTESARALGLGGAVPRGGRRQPKAPQLLEAERQLKLAKSDLRATKEFFELKPIQENLRRRTPVNPEGISLLTHKMLLNTFKTPETLLQQLGVTGARTFEQLADAARESTIAFNLTRNKMIELRNVAGRVMGVRGRAKKRGEFFLPVVKAYETGGLRAVGELNPGLVPVMREMERDMRSAIEKLVRLGAIRRETADELRARGVMRLFPHMLQRDVSRNKLLTTVGRRLQAQGQTAEDASRLSRALFDRQGTYFGLVGDDAQRLLNGTLDDLIQAGLPVVKDPFLALDMFLNQAAFRLAYGKRFGATREVIKTTTRRIETAVEREGGSSELMRSVLDASLGLNVEDQAGRSFFDKVANLQIASKLALAVIPNASQPSNTAMLLGMRNTARGLGLALRGEKANNPVSKLLRSLGVGQTILTTERNVFLDQQGNNVATQAADFVLRGSGFVWFERFNRQSAVATGIYTIQDTLSRALAGRLRGSSLDKARRRFGSLGLRLDDTVAQIRRRHSGTPAEMAAAYFQSKAGRDLLLKGGFNAARATQFILDPTRRPLWWNTPVGRVVFQFKQFALQQARFLRDMVVGEAAAGNLRPAAFFLSAYPMVGEVVGDVRSIFSQRVRPEDGFSRYADNILSVGGFGIVTDMGNAVMRGRTLEFFGGPTVTDVSQLLQSTVRGDIDGVFRNVFNDPVFQVATFMAGAGILTADMIEQHFEQLDQDNRTGVDEVEVPDVREFMLRRERGSRR